MADPMPPSLTANSPSQAQPNGRVKATVLSCYDLPDDVAQPDSVILEVLGASVGTGPPLARHKDRNSFKFGNNGGNANDLLVQATLSELYDSVVTFRVQFSDKQQPDLVAQFHMSNRLQVNETKWLILNLRPDDKKEKTLISSCDDSNSDSNNSAPTLRVKVVLNGPYRSEVASLISVFSSWFSTVDHVSSNLESSVDALKKLPAQIPAIKYLLLPILPMTVSLVAVLPIVLGVLVVGLPLFLPVIAMLLVTSLGVAAVGGLLYCSTATGRQSMLVFLHPIFTTFLATPTGQKVIYDVGPRPSPKNLAQFLLPDDIIGKLITSLVMDFIGSTSYLLPIVGEGFDLVWAPLYGICIAAMYDDTTPNLKYVAFAEEILPFTDVIPSATFGWLKEFGPTFLDQGKETVHHFTVMARRERSALNNHQPTKS
mmetsp:Transcript_37853/g.55752  ORF Transcript_37853/g.55752 Transcript_37853/m.55752 type:complete len:427 (+) Transcript_37853:96-1376(+)|eukprot:CAMPEP_0195526868 /NCGR_PEP_ID=MMETSP0794_2-20130614/28170_1 /TAXON_ID=515487 /ORGANISM="Stephanopyxis turris, Strain CCMP 815" /LENGTH=426 /DNA_ID=CAMNT_0040657653 /DNA_START=85 /DNA_END=1365 /DNA_ORIENTATION=-